MGADILKTFTRLQRLKSFYFQFQTVVLFLCLFHISAAEGRMADDEHIKYARISVPSMAMVSKENFISEIYPQRHPVVLKGLDLGCCTSSWTPEYLSHKGGNSNVKIHVSMSTQLDFLRKNFVYRTLPFDTFVLRAAELVHKEYFLSETERYYLRSLGDDPRKDIADIKVQYPQLADDIIIPEYFSPEQFYSSVFRVGSPGVQLWTHYDVMDNFLIQVTGRKRVVLFSPRDAEYMYLNGDKSEVLDIDTPDMQRYPLFAKATRYECLLEAGDVIFIPALWFHNTISLEFGVSVNVFWKHLPKELYDMKDTYGNKDPTPVPRAFQILERAIKTLEDLPEEYRDFYARRMILKIREKCLLKETEDGT